MDAGAPIIGDLWYARLTIAPVNRIDGRLPPPPERARITRRKTPAETA